MPLPVVKPLVIRVLDVRQGDAILVENGESRVLIDGGPNRGLLGKLLDSYNLNGTRLQAVILTHEHFDHYNGLLALFESTRHIAIDVFFENRDASLNSSMKELRDSIAARVALGEMSLRDTDDPCGSGSRMCTLSLQGGARLEILRPEPTDVNQNNRSVAVKLVGPDSASFAMWLAGDAERSEIAYFDTVDYDVTPGMRATVLKANHHGSCNGITSRYLNLIRPEFVVMSLGQPNAHGFVHTQTLDILRDRGIPWYRTDVNGTITIRTGGTPQRRFTIEVERGAQSPSGSSDSLSKQRDCRTM